VNPFVQRITHRSDQWVWPVSGMCLILGFMVMIAQLSDTNFHSRLAFLNPNQKDRVAEGAVDIDAFRELQTEVTSLRSEKTQLENLVAGKGEATKLLNNSLQSTKAFAGLTPVEGPGVSVTLRDSPHPESIKIQGQLEVPPQNNIHDTDVLQLVNELFAAGAEAVSVNDHRIAGPTSIRCVGPTILIDDINIASPIVVQAIGDPKTLEGALNLNGGVLDDFRRWDPDMVQEEKKELIRLDPYSGRTEFRVARVPKT
jgi:uncharacterized protein YlxW (UPF0749 family)